MVVPVIMKVTNILLCYYRYWDLVQTHKVTQFYTAPTASKCCEQ
jgi:acyl-coenzyme A synthetase/AMP-(fatty) acid ligase